MSKYLFPLAAIASVLGVVVAAITWLAIGTAASLTGLGYLAGVTETHWAIVYGAALMLAALFIWGRHLGRLVFLVLTGIGMICAWGINLFFTLLFLLPGLLLYVLSKIGLTTMRGAVRVFEAVTTRRY
jgi:hypothetical protein